MTWEGNVGVEGGIPRVTTVNTYFPTAVSLSTVQSALRNCPSNQVVQLGPWTTTWSGDLDWQGVPNGVVLRGTTNSVGTPLTHIISTDTMIYMRGTYSHGSISTEVNLNADGVKGATTLQVNTPSWARVGVIIGVDQLDDPALSTNTGQENADGYRELLGNGPRGMGQLIKITSTTPTSISFQPPLFYGWQTARQAQIFQSGYNPDSNGPRRRCGIEDIRFEHTGSNTDNHMIRLENADNCWIRNVHGTNLAGGVYVLAMFSYRCEVRHCNFDNSKQLGGGQGYGVGLYHWCTGWLVEDNIFRRLHVAMQNNYGSAGNVFAYNFETDGQSTSGQNPGFNAHGATGIQTLVEGNYMMDKVNGDYTHGSGNTYTIFRNRVLGRNPTQSRDQAVISVEQYERRWNIVGNVLGTAGFHTSYDAGYGGTGYGANDCGDSTHLIYKFGFYSNWGCDTRSGDTFAVTDALRAVNHDTVTSTNGGLVLGGRLVSDLRDSYYLATKPAYFGSLPWPPYGPDRPATAMATNIPAGYRFFFGRDPSLGPVNNPPIVQASANRTSGLAPLAVSFSSAGSSDPEGANLTYSWSFGDGTFATTANPSHTYQNEGSYQARLTVSDGTNSVSSSYLTILVGNQPPVAAISGSPSVGPAPLTVSFSSAGSSDPENAALSYAWVFGDGGTSTAANPSHTYQVDGNYVARVTVSDGSKSTVSTDLTIRVGSFTPGLVAAYGLDEGTGGAAVDWSTNSNHGTINGATWTTGRFGNALAFDGTSDMVVVNGSPSLNLSSAMTLEAWVYPVSLGSGWSDIIYKSGDVYFLMGHTPQGAPDMGGTFASANVYGTSPLPLNTWTHLAGTYDGATMRFYVNGVQVASRAQTGAIQTSSGPLSFGGDPGSSQFWTGRIDEVRVYNRALSSGEIVADMNNPVRTSMTPPSPPSNLQVFINP